MIKKLINKLVETSRKDIPKKKKLKALIADEFIFLFIVPWFLILPAEYLRRLFNMPEWATLSSLISVSIMITGVSISLLGVKEQWVQGKGTPSLNAPTTKLVTTGVFSLCRNPIQLGAIIYITGLGILVFSVATGLVAGTAGLAAGILYIKLIEENELRIRFGDDFENYCQKTPFIIPAPWLKQFFKGK